MSEVNEVKEEEKNKKKPGRTCKLSVEEQVLITIQQGAGISTTCFKLELIGTYQNRRFAER